MEVNKIGGNGSDVFVFMDQIVIKYEDHKTKQIILGMEAETDKMFAELVEKEEVDQDIIESISKFVRRDTIINTGPQLNKIEFENYFDGKKLNEVPN
ncbi:unnamed protein product [Caenorhabditis angaria]|uniref:Uncharacterized protein n=1 Tax=Caenorhabditis angaria TaxID=860376 RepID=A0A9P1N1U0_9PELO|nr:unnamed protein product [Caenorhabditis angaria]